MTPDQKLLEELVHDVQRLTYEEKQAVRHFIDLLDAQRKHQVSRFVRSTMSELVDSPAPIAGLSTPE